ncbi:hypothetical protein, partial [Trueperella pyogenes]
MKTEALPLEALEQAIVLAKDNLDGLVHHCDHGSEAYWVLFLPVFERIGTCRRGIHRSLRIVRCGWSLIVLLMIG